MEKRNRKAGHSYSLRDRILAQIMVIIVTLTMIPFDSLVVQAASTTTVKSVGSIRTEYEVDYGTSKDDIGLPSELSVILETVISSAGATNGGTEYSEDTVDESVSWEGYYDGDTPGDYALTAEFDDGSLYYDDMPTVKVTVREPETAPGSDAGDEGEDDEDPDQPVVTGETQGQSTENEALRWNEDGTPSSPAEAFELYYNNGDGHGTAKTIQPVNVSIASEPTYAGEYYLAGEYISYSVSFTVRRAATFAYNKVDEEYMFDEWTDIRAVVDLPDEVEIDAIIDAQDPNVTYSYSQQPDGTYLITLPPELATQSSHNDIDVAFNINCKIKDNGKLPDMTELESVTATALAHADVNLGGTTGDLDPAFSDTSDNAYVSTPDHWTIEKTPASPAPSYNISEDKQTVTIHYVIEYGLGVKQSDGSYQLNRSETFYKQPGRVPFAENPVLEDVMQLTTPDGDTSLTPLSATLTTEEAGYVLNDEVQEDVVTIDLLNTPQVTLPYKPVGENDDDVDEMAPALSTYNVDVVYDYNEFITWYYENYSSHDSESKNTATITSALATAVGEPVEVPSTDDAVVIVPGYNPPAKLTIEKWIVGWNATKDGEEWNYQNKYATDMAPVTGNATYTVEKKNPDGTYSAAQMWYLDGNEYKSITGNTLTINPQGSSTSHTNGTDGTVSVFLDAGTYKITETGHPEHTTLAKPEDGYIEIELKTINEEQTGLAKFFDQELLGQVKVIKYEEGDETKKLGGAKFGIYPTQECAEADLIATVTTKASGADIGTAVFERLEPDTYWVKEIDAPAGYLLDETPKQVEVTANNTDAVAYKFYDTPNGTWVGLHKLYSTVAAPGTWNDVNCNNMPEFYGAFVLERKLVTDPETAWETFIDEIDVTDEGRAAFDGDDGILAYDENQVKYQYRFVETLPANYYDVNGGTGDADRKVYSDVITPADALTDDDHEVEMRNMQGGTIELTKKKATLTINAKTGAVSRSEAIDGNREFVLYRYSDLNGYEQVATGTTDSSTGKVTFKGLTAAAADSAGTAHNYTYYVHENNTADGYLWDYDQTITVDGNEITVVTLGQLAGAENNKLIGTTYNIEQKIGIKIYKKDKATGSQLEGAVIAINDGTNTVTVTTKKDVAVAKDLAIGKVYTITEQSVPTGYYLDDTTGYRLDTTGWTVEREDDGTYAVYDSDHHKVEDNVLTVEFKDTPMPKIKVAKQARSEAEGSTAYNLSDVTFEIYKKNDEDGTITKCEGLTILANGSNTVTLPSAGTYYLHEVKTTRTDIVYPDSNIDLYEEFDADQGEPYPATGDDRIYLFGPYEVEDPQENDPDSTVIDLGTITNINNERDLEVEKILYDQNGNEVSGDKRNGFKIILYTVDEDGNKTPVFQKNNQPIGVNTGNTMEYGKTVPAAGEVGKVLFKKLPVYDENGNKITYYAEEVLNTDQQALYYYRSGENKTEERELDTTTNKTEFAQKIRNRSRIPIEVDKKYYDRREHDLTGLEYNLQGAEIAVYAVSDDGTTLTYVAMTTTNVLGQAIFGSFEEPANGYVGIEVSIPDDPKYEYMVPVNGKSLLPKVPGQDTPVPPTLDYATALEQYNCVVLEKKTSTNNNVSYQGTLYNEIPWVQIHITKVDRTNPNKKLDNCDFTLWKQILTDDQISHDPDNPYPLSFDENNCTAVGSYTTGQLLDKNGDNIKGEFQTDVLVNADNIVYWLVEDSACTGYSIIPTQNYVLFTRQDDANPIYFENTTNDGVNGGVYYTTDGSHDDPNGEQGMIDNKINHHLVMNEPGIGPGEGIVNFAFIKFSKWMQTDVNKPDEMVLMPNAVFELYAVDEDGNEIEHIDTITTGDENDMNGTTTGYGISKFIDGWELYRVLSDKLGENVGSSINFYAGSKTAGYETEPSYPFAEGPNGEPKRREGKFEVRACLKEINCSSQYSVDIHEHNLMITIPTGETNLGNDKYFVNVRQNSANDCDKPANEGKIAAFDDSDVGRIAIVDHITTSPSVLLQHFGYDPAVVGFEMMHTDLESVFNRTQFEGVAVPAHLERIENGALVEWNPATNQQATSEADAYFDVTKNGYSFPKGLMEGVYRVSLRRKVDGYESYYEKYETMYLGELDTYFYFTVGASDSLQTYRIYSPERPKLTIEKTDLSGENSIDTATFKLTSVTTGITYSKTASTTDGEAVFYNLPADAFYTLEETSAPAGYTNTYFKELFKEAYKDDYANLVESSGYQISYQTSTRSNGIDNPAEPDAKQMERIILEPENIDHQFNLSAMNVKKVKLQITKKDQLSKQPKAGAKYRVYYKTFDKVTGDYTIPAFDADTWTKYPGDVVTEGDDGTKILEDLDPGVYYVVETDPPTGYDINSTPQIAVMTGGLDINVIGNYNDLNEEVGGTGQLTFFNLPKSSVTLTKIIDNAENAELDLADGTYKFTFMLKDEDGDTVKEAVTATIVVTNGSVTSNTPADFGELSKEHKYYLKETKCEGPDASYGYQIKDVILNKVTTEGESTEKLNVVTEEDATDEEIAAGLVGYYRFEVPVDGTIGITFTNVLLKGRVTILKYDGETPSKHLKGAHFEVRDEKGAKVGDAVDNGDGTYTAIVSLKVSEDGTNYGTFTLVETQAPTNEDDPSQHYVIDEENRTIVVEFKRDENGKLQNDLTFDVDDELKLPNYVGAHIDLAKFGGLSGEDEDDLEPLDGVKFQLYYRRRKEDESYTAWQKWHQPQTTTNGVASFEILDRYEYAFVEEGGVPGYKGLESVYKITGGQRVLLDTEETETRTYYLLGDSSDYHNGQTYAFKAYNIPYLKLNVEKHDLTGEVTRPVADFTVYEVPESAIPKNADGTLKEELTEAEITAIIAACDSSTALSDSTEMVAGENYSSYVNEEYLEPGMTYLAVENKAREDKTSSDYSIVLDDADVVSYKIFSIPNKEYDEEYTVEFVNTKLTATVGVTKDVKMLTADEYVTKEGDDYYVRSLLNDKAVIHYWVNPSADNTSPLDPNEKEGHNGEGYRLTDSGLEPEFAKEPGSLPKEWYTINSVQVGQSTMETTGITTAKGSYPIFAKVTFVDFDDNTYPQDAVDVTYTATTVNAPAGKNIKSFYVDYYSEQLADDTGYALGKNFDPVVNEEGMQVEVTVFQQTKPSEEEKISRITKVTNNVDVESQYTPWDETRGQKKDQVTLTDDASADVLVKPAPIAKIDFTKSGTPGTVRLGSELTYILTLTNMQTDSADLIDPVILDLLPMGLEYVSYEAHYVQNPLDPGTVNEVPQVIKPAVGQSECVIYEFEGVLKPGESITITIKAQMTDSVTSYGRLIKNYAFTTSANVGVQTTDNGTGAVIMDKDEALGMEIVSIARALGCDDARANELKNKLGDLKDNGYLGDTHENTWSSNDKITLDKSQYGPGESIYYSNRVARVTNDADPDLRTMHYKLSVNNVSPSLKRTNLVVMDVLPKPGDQSYGGYTRNSKWDLYFDGALDEVLSVTVNGEATSRYKMFYYPNPNISSINAAEMENVIRHAKLTGTAPDGWEPIESLGTGKAYALLWVFDYVDDPANAVVLNPDCSLQIEYTATTDERGQEALNSIVFTNAINDFASGLTTFSGSQTPADAHGETTHEDDPNGTTFLASNIVQVTITPPEVKVGGDVWIDVNDDGIQNDGGQDWFYGFKIVQELLDKLDVTLLTSNEKNDGLTEFTDGSFIALDDPAFEEAWKQDDDYYGFGHFGFDHLVAAKLYNGDDPATEDDDFKNWKTGGDLYLAGNNPYHYYAGVKYTGNAFKKTGSNNAPNGSFNPEKSWGAYENEHKDDNFYTTGSYGYQSDWFFLHQTSNIFDMTKDIGFNIKRDLTLTKIGKTTGEEIEGAEFKIYGPFDHDAAITKDTALGSAVATGTTDENGIIKVTGLQYFNKYVIKETKAGDGYSINGATAEGVNITPVAGADGLWVLNVPDVNISTDSLRIDSETGNVIETVTVKDPDLIQIKPAKVWQDNNDPYGERPDSIWVQLYTVETNDEGQKVYTVAKDDTGNDVKAIELKKENNYVTDQYWKKLPKFKAGGEEIVYDVKEYEAYTNEQTNTPLNGYTAETERDGEVITITNTPPYTQLVVNKEWEGDTGATVGNIGNYIKSVTFRLQRKVKGDAGDPTDVLVNGNVVEQTVVRGINTKTFSNLPAKNAAGQEYEYSAKEVSMIVVDSEGNVSAGDLSAYTFTHTASGTTVTYTNTLKKGKLQFLKVWDDNNNQDGERPESVTITVTAQATDYFEGYSATVTLNEANKWGHDNDNPVELEVPVKDAKGNTITYTIVESNVPSYTVTYAVDGVEVDPAVATVDADETTSVTVTNTHEPNVVSVEATKEWNDEDDLYGERPGDGASITFTLYADGDPALDQDGNDISVQTISPENGVWPNAEWDNLPEKKDGEFIVYTVEETEITGYTTEYDPEDQVIVFENNVGTITVINTPIPTSLHIKKTWANEIDDEDVNQASLIKSVTFTIQKSVKDEDNWSNVTKNNDVYTKTLDRDGATFVEADVTGLPKYNSEGQELEYRAVETSMRVEDLEGNVHNVDINGDIIGAYNMVVNPTGSNITEITNSFIKGWLKVKKIWVDNNDRDGIRPQSLTITITEDSDFIDYTGTIVLDDHNHWGADLEAIELPVKNLDGTDITYTITEEAVTGYTPEYEITVDGVKVSEGEAVTGTTTLTEDKTTEDTYTNTHEPETTSKTVTKFWDDEDDLYGNRPETITFALYRTYDGLETPELVTVDDDGVELTNPAVVSKNEQGLWKYTWTNLPVYLEGQSGTAITYSVAETEINGIPVADFYGYTVTADGDTIINTPVTTGLDIYKYWDANELSCIADTVTEVKFKVQKSIDGTNFDDVEYTADGTTHVLETSIVKTNGTWGSAEVNGLPAYDPDNNPYTYRAKEIAIKVNGEWVDADDDTVGGYNISQEDTPGANTPAPATARDLSEITNTPIRGQLGVKKVWEDQDNAYNTRPGNITVTLEAEANGVAITGLPASTVLNATNGWEDTTTWGAVPVKDAAGNDIEYTFTEPTTGSYKAYVTVTSEEEGNTGTTPISEGSLTEITFTNKLITTSFNVEKKFPDETNRDLAYFVNQFKSQIKSIKVRLQRQEGENWINVLNNNAVVEVDLNEQNGWKYTWENLPKNYADGTLIQYRAIEVSYTTANGTHEVTYTSADHQESGTVAAFNYTSTTVAAVGDDIATTTINNSIKVGRLVAFKIWDDDNDRDKLRPEAITFYLFCNGKQLPADVYKRELKAITDEAGVAHDDQTTVPMEDKNNYVVWTTLPVYDVDGINYKYSYSEKLGSGSAANPPQESIIKSIMNIFLANDEDTDVVDPTEGTGDGTAEGGAAGGEGSGNAQSGYAVEIEDSTGDYTATVDVELPTIIIELSDVITKVTNTHEPLVTEMSVKKEWEGNFIYGDHPKEVIVYLRAKYEDNDGNIIDELAQPEHKDHKFVNPVTLNEENNWEYTWTDLPVNKTGYVGHEITYYVVEEPVPNGFELDPDKQEMIREVLEHIGSVDVFTSKFTVLNTMLTTSLEVNKEWIDEEPAIAEKIKSVSFKVQRSIDDGETWMDLVITDPVDEGQEAGQVVILTIDKEETTAYIDNLPTHSAEGDAYLYRAVEIGYTLKDGTFVKVKYDENTETSGTVGAYNYTSETINPGEGTDPTEPTEPTEPELPQRGEAGDGTEGPGETPETTDGYVTNVTNKTIRGAIKVTKTWKNDSDNNRPKSLKIQLTTFAGKNKITLKGIKYSTELTSANNWTDTTTWEKVPVLDEYGNKIIYMLEEPEVNRYSASYQIVYNNKELESGSSRAFSTDVYENGVIEGRLINRYNPPANKTGDDAPLAAAGGALAVGLAGLAAVLARKKRRV